MKFLIVPILVNLLVFIVSKLVNLLVFIVSKLVIYFKPVNPYSDENLKNWNPLLLIHERYITIRDVCIIGFPPEKRG